MPRRAPGRGDGCSRSEVLMLGRVGFGQDLGAGLRVAGCGVAAPLEQFVTVWERRTVLLLPCQFVPAAGPAALWMPTARRICSPARARPPGLPLARRPW